MAAAVFWVSKVEVEWRESGISPDSPFLKIARTRPQTNATVSTFKDKDT